jgi:hypothetical protein
MIHTPLKLALSKLRIGAWENIEPDRLKVVVVCS